MAESIVTCPACQARLKLPRPMERVRCPRCQQPFAPALSNSHTAASPQTEKSTASPGSGAAPAAHRPPRPAAAPPPAPRPVAAARPTAAKKTSSQRRVIHESEGLDWLKEPRATAAAARLPTGKKAASARKAAPPQETPLFNWSLHCMALGLLAVTLPFSGYQLRIIAFLPDLAQFGIGAATFLAGMVMMGVFLVQGVKPQLDLRHVGFPAAMVVLSLGALFFGGGDDQLAEHEEEPAAAEVVEGPPQLANQFSDPSDEAAAAIQRPLEIAGAFPGQPGGNTPSAPAVPGLTSPSPPASFGNFPGAPGHSPPPHAEPRAPGQHPQTGAPFSFPGNLPPGVTRGNPPPGFDAGASRPEFPRGFPGQRPGERSAAPGVPSGGDADDSFLRQNADELLGQYPRAERVRVIFRGFERREPSKMSKQLSDLAGARTHSGSSVGDEFHLYMAPVRNINVFAGKITIARVERVDVANQTIFLVPL